MNQPDKPTDPDIILIDKAVDALGEHWDSVRIFCTRYDSNGTTSYATRSTGNAFASQGYISAWLNAEKERATQEFNDNSDPS